VFASLLALLVYAVAGYSQQPADPGSQQLIERLLQRIDELEVRVKTMEDERVEASTPRSAVGAIVSPPAAPAVSSAPESLPAASAADQATIDAAMQEAGGSGVPAAHHFGLLQIRGFSDFSFGRPVEDNLPPGGLASSANSFSLGDLSLFITSQLTSKLSFYSELLFTSDFTNDFNAEIDRMLLQYRVNDYFAAGIGKFNTAIGYYTNAFHRASFFQTTTGRPFMYSDEDSAGILPIHSIGLTTTGKLPSGKLGLHWVAEIANGRASNPDAVPVQNFFDESSRKAVNFALYAKPDALPGLEAGFSAYDDTLYPAGFVRTGELILSAHAVYVRPRWEFLNEAVMMDHSPEGQDRTFRSLMGYTQLSHKMGVIRPFLRYEYQNVPVDDPIFGATGLRRGGSAGIRYDFGEFAAFKLQLGRTTWHGESTTEVQSQLSITF
jgi:hypothetical protein